MNMLVKNKSKSKYNNKTERVRIHSNNSSTPSSNNETNKKRHSYSLNNNISISTSMHRLSSQLGSRMYDNNNDAKDSLYPLREQSRISNTDDIKSSKFPNKDLFTQYDSSPENIRADNSRSSSLLKSTSHKYSTNNQSNMKTFDNLKRTSSLSRRQSPIYVDNSDVTDVQTNYKNYPASRDRNTLNTDERYSRSNWNNYLQIDNQLYSNQYPNNNLSNYNNDYYHSIDKCENCKRLTLQNENAQSEIRTLESEINKINEKYKLEINKNESEKVKMQSEIEYHKSNNENLQSKFDLLNDSNKHLLNKYENMKLEMSKYKSEIENMKCEISDLGQLNNYFQNENGKLEKQVKDLESSKFEIMKIHNKEKSESSEDNLNQPKSDIKQTLLDNSKPTPLKSKSIIGSLQRIKPTSLNGNLLKPMGFENPKGYCFLNCVVQQFYSCKDYRNELIEYHNTSQIADLHADETTIFVSETIYINV